MKITTLAILMAAAVCGLNFTTANHLSLIKSEKADLPILDYVSSGFHQLTWDPISGTGTYTVAILNLNTNTPHSTFSTTATSSLVYGLVSGNNYRIMISRGASIITVDNIAP